MYTIENLDLTQINRDINGNPRYVVNFVTFTKNSDSTQNSYSLGLKRAKTIGGKKYHTKTFGGGIVFQTLNVLELKKDIINLVNSL